MEISEVIGQNLRSLRLERNLSLGQLAERSGVSKVMLSQIERGDSNPTVSTLFKIVSGLGVSYSALMEQRVPEVSVVRQKDAPTQVSEGGAYRISCYFPSAPERDFEIYGAVLEAGASHETDGHGEGTEEFVFVVAGELAMSVGGEERSLAARDAIHFDASLPHAYRNEGEAPVEMVIVNRYPSG